MVQLSFSIRICAGLSLLERFEMYPEENRSFPEDYHLENGNYCNMCIDCLKEFVGHKRRILCKICENKHKENYSKGIESDVL